MSKVTEAQPFEGRDALTLFRAWQASSNAMPTALAWKVEAALEAASSTPDGGAVAWRWQSLETDAATPFWFDRMTGGRPEPSEFVRNVTPLYAHPAPISKGVTVKALAEIEVLIDNCYSDDADIPAQLDAVLELVRSCLSTNAGEIEAGGEVERLALDVEDVVWRLTDEDLRHIADSKDVASCRYRIKDALHIAMRAILALKESRL